MRYLYLHGFASGPHSRKAQAFLTQFAAAGIHLEVPDLSAGDFEHLTVSGQLAVIEDCLNNQPSRLVGSSMGGYLAALYASTHPAVDKLVLLAPAFGFAGKWDDAAWRDAGWRDFYDYSECRMRRVHYGLVTDALRFPPHPRVTCPVLAFHGIHDAVVPIDAVRSWSLKQPCCELKELDSGHELLNVLSQITEESIPFLTGSANFNLVVP